MALKILPHGRLQEWVAEEQGYFAAEGLGCTFLPEGDYWSPAGQVSIGAFETFGAGRGGAGISCACHWATNAAAGPEPAPYDEAVLSSSVLPSGRRASSTG